MVKAYTKVKKLCNLVSHKLRMATPTANRNISANEDCVTKISNCSAAMAHLTAGHVTLHYPAASVPLYVEIFYSLKQNTFSTRA